MPTDSRLQALRTELVEALRDTPFSPSDSGLFAAAVAHAGFSLIPAYWGEGVYGYGYSAVAAADRFPWSHPELYFGQSPLAKADRIETPLLLTHGKSDENVPIGESEVPAARLIAIPPTNSRLVIFTIHPSLCNRAWPCYYAWRDAGP